MRGTLNAPFFVNQRELPEIKALWKEAQDKSKKAITARQHIPNKASVGVNRLLDPGTKIYIFVGPKNKKVEAVVIHDNGITCCVKKVGGSHRFDVITIHKKNISVIPTGKF